MQSVALLLIGIQLVYAGMHSHIVIYTATKGVPDFPEFVAATMVDGTQVNYYDSEIKEVIPRQDWVRGAVDEEFWQRNTQIRSNMHQAFKNNINTAMQRFNQTQGVHIVQIMYGCEWDDETEATDGFEQHGYDGEDFLALDLKELKWVSPVPQGFITQQKWNGDKADLEFNKQYYGSQCIEWLKKYVQYGKSSLKKTVSPQVSLLQKDPSSPVSCHATGFYPSGVTISWKKNGEDHHEDVDLGELLLNEDGTFQKMSTLRVTPDEWKKNQFICVIEHQGKTIRKTEEEILTNYDPVPIGIIIGAVVAVILLIVIGVAGYLVYQRKKGETVRSSENSSAATVYSKTQTTTIQNRQEHNPNRRTRDIIFHQTRNTTTNKERHARTMTDKRQLIHRGINTQGTQGLIINRCR